MGEGSGHCALRYTRIAWRPADAPSGVGGAEGCTCGELGAKSLPQPLQRLWPRNSSTISSAHHFATVGTHCVASDPRVISNASPRLSGVYHFSVRYHRRPFIPLSPAAVRPRDSTPFRGLCSAPSAAPKPAWLDHTAMASAIPLALALVLALAAGGALAAPKPWLCPPKQFDSVPNFDLAKFISAPW